MKVEKEILLESLKNLQIPFNISFFNKPLSHYENLSEQIGFRKVERYLVDILLYYKDDIQISEKARTLLRKLNSVMLIEGTDPKNRFCECGYELLDNFEKCPVCGKNLHNGKKCYYKNSDSTCSLDAKECKWANYNQCGKLDS